MFRLKKSRKGIRRGELVLRHGTIQTPFFMPDATRAFVKGLSKDDLEAAGAAPMVVNTYHLFLQPGLELIRKAGGVNRFMNWEKPLLSDSGGYQVFSLIHRNRQMGQVTEDEVVFRSPLDGSTNILTPEKAIEIQFDLGVDMMVCLDDPVPNTYPKNKIAQAVERTLRWAGRCKAEYERQLKKRKIAPAERPLLFGVIQGGAYLDLRRRCVEGLVAIGFDGYGFGARHIDQDGEFMEEVMRFTAGLIPEKSLRFALGVGTPEDIVRCYSLGWDMFDCVIPTREGRHGRLFIRKSKIGTGSSGRKGKSGKFYETININNQRFRKDMRPVDPNCDCDLCRNFSRSYLRHLFVSRDPLGSRLASLHNLRFYFRMMGELRKGG